MTDDALQIELGQVVRDKITGFQGTVIGRCEYLTGCNTFGIKPRMSKDDKTIPDTVWIDEGQLEIISAGPLEKNTDDSKPDGGPQDEPTPIAHP